MHVKRRKKSKVKTNSNDFQVNQEKLMRADAKNVKSTTSP
jgi:hypothetical protein